MARHNPFFAALTGLVAVAALAPACSTDSSGPPRTDSNRPATGGAETGGVASAGGKSAGGSTSDNGGSTSDNGGSTSDNGGSTSDNGGSTSDNGGSTSDSGGSTSNGGMTAGRGGNGAVAAGGNTAGAGASTGGMAGANTGGAGRGGRGSGGSGAGGSSGASSGNGGGQTDDSGAPHTIDHYVTFYGWPDNDPAGNGIAYPKLHQGASGTGTHADPITFATDPKEWAPGTILYVPYLRRYVIMEDSCADCITDWKSGKYHIDLWLDSDGTHDSQVLACENTLTRNKTAVEVNPPPDRPVDATPLFNLTAGTCNPP